MATGQVEVEVAESGCGHKSMVEEIWRAGRSTTATTSQSSPQGWQNTFAWSAAITAECHAVMDGECNDVDRPCNMINERTLK